MRFLCGLTLVLVLVSVLESQQPADQTEPTVGQPGKDVMWVPTPPELVEKMLDMADVTPADVVMDLGSGDGRTVIAAAARGARAIGVEYEAGLVELSQRRAVEASVADRVTFVAADLFRVDLSTATVITMFLTPDINLELRARLLDLEPGTRIVSNTWDMEDWAADEVAVIDPCPGWCTSLLWYVPAKVEGTWRSARGELVLEQQFQVVSGTLRAGGEAIPIGDGRLRGDQISFQAGGARYSGRVVGLAIDGTVRTGGRTFGWIATRVDR